MADARNVGEIIDQVNWKKSNPEYGETNLRNEMGKSEINAESAKT
jgi:hypothetical protein